nr:hypothetical protein [Tanacetum cinerariifolium]
MLERYISALCLPNAYLISDNSCNTNKTVNTAHSVFAASSKDQASTASYADDVMFSFFSNQSNTLQLDNEELKQIDTDDLEEMDLKWQVAMLTIRVKRRCHFARKCMAPRNQGNRNTDAPTRNAPAEEELTNFALMAYTSQGSSSSDSKVHTCSKECLKSYEALQKQYDQQREAFNNQISAIEKTGLGYDGQMNESELNNIHVNESEVLNNVVDSCESDRDDNQVNDRFKKGEGYHAVPPPYTGKYMPSRADLFFARLDNSVFKSKMSETITSVSKIETNASKTSKDSLEKPKTVRPSAPLIEEWESDSEDDNVFKPKEVNKIVKPSLEKIKFVNARNTIVENENKAEKPRKFSQSPRAKTNNFNEKVNTAKVNNVTTTGPKAVVSVVEGNRNNVVKSSACWIWRTKGNLIDHISKDSGSYTLKRFNYVDPQGKFKFSKAVWLDLYMVVQAPKDMGESSEIPTDPHHTPIVTQPSSSLPQKKQKSRRKQRKEIKVPSPSSEIHNEESVPITSNDPLPSGEDRMQLNKLMILCTNLQKYGFDLEEAKTAQTMEIASLKKRVKKLEQKRKSRTSGLKRLRKVGSARRVESSTKASLGDHEDASKQGRMVDNIDQDVEITLAITTAAITVTAAGPRPKAKGIVMQEPSERPTPTPIISSQKASQAKDKGKRNMVEPERPLKRKDQIMMDVEIAKNLEAQMQAELEEEERLARLKEEETNIALVAEWDNTQAMMDADCKLATRLQEEEREELTTEEQTTPLSSKSPTIADYKIYKEWRKSYFKIIRADGNSQSYLSFGKMFKNFNREDLEVLWSIVKARFKKTKPIDDMDNMLFQTLKTMFEHHVKDNIWKYQQGLAKMWNDVMLQVDYEVEMAYDLLRLIRRQINEGYVPE